MRCQVESDVLRQFAAPTVNTLVTYGYNLGTPGYVEVCALLNISALHLLCLLVLSLCK